VVEVVVEVAAFPGLDQSLGVSEELLIPALDEPGGTIGDGLEGVVLGFENGDSSDKESIKLNASSSGTPDITSELAT